jgi:hypothetical protein
VDFDKTDQILVRYSVSYTGEKIRIQGDSILIIRGFQEGL